MVECDRECAKQYFPTVFSVILLLADAISSCSIDEKAEVLNGFIAGSLLVPCLLFMLLTLAIGSLETDLPLPNTLMTTCL